MVDQHLGLVRTTKLFWRGSCYDIWRVGTNGEFAGAARRSYAGARDDPGPQIRVQPTCVVRRRRPSGFGTPGPDSRTERIRGDYLDEFRPDSSDVRRRGLRPCGPRL